MHNIYRRFLFPFLLVGLLLGAAVTVQSGVAQEPIPPSDPPAAEPGLALYAARCANCHGPTGAGDGELAAAQGLRPAALNDPLYRRTAEPAMIYEIITNGALAVGMPPFGPGNSNPIDADGRWDLVAAVYNLSTPPDAIARGQVVYLADCAACHGENGTGAGPQAADFDPPPTDLTGLDYWFTRSNQAVFTALQPGSLPGHDYALDDDALWDAVDYARTFSYVYQSDAPLAASIPAATVSGTLLNGSTGALVGELPVTLRAFTREFEEVLTQTTTADADGRFLFTLSDVGVDWIFLASAAYQNLSFSSNPNRFDPANPALELPVTVYEQTTDPGVISLEQIHTLLEFAPDRVRISEIYLFNNNSTAVFIGATGSSAEGTVALALPAGAENVTFERSFDDLNSFLPADEVIETETGWADTLPLRPGVRATNLFISYELPYTDGMRIAHPVFYDAARASVIMMDVGVRLVEEAAWVFQGAQQMGAQGSVLSYGRGPLAAGDALSFALNGRPQIVTDSAGNLVAVRDEGAELIIGAAALLAVVVGAGLTVRAWRGAAPADAPPADPDALLRALADLDDAHAAGRIAADAYAARRRALLTELIAIWPRNGK